MIKHNLIITLLFVLAISPVAHTQDEMESDSIMKITEGDKYWREAWDIEISAVPQDFTYIPDSLVLKITNRSEKELQGANPVFHLYGLDAWALDDEIRKKDITLAPGDSLMFRLGFKAMIFKGHDGKLCDTTVLFERMKKEPWKIQCSLSDISSPKPMIESSFLVWSNIIECNKPEKKSVGDE